MTGGPVAFVAAFLDGWGGVSRFFVIFGLVLGVVNCLRFLSGRVAVELAAADSAPARQHFGVARLVRGPVPSVFWPLGLVWIGFWVGSRFGTTLWAVLVGVLVLVAVVLALHLVRAEHGVRGDRVVAPPVVAVILAAGALLLFGLLLTVRLVVVPDPTVGVGGGVNADAADQAKRAVLVPGIAIVLALAAATGRAAGMFRRVGRAPGRSDRRHLVALGVVVLLFAAPLVAGGNSLTVLGVATPEYGKVLYVWVLAAMLADHAYGFRTRPKLAGLGVRELVKTRRHIVYPVAAFGLLGVTSVVKNDIGPMIPLFAATVAMIVHVLAAEVRRSLDVPGGGFARLAARVRAGLGYARPLLVPLAVIAVLAALVMSLTSYVSRRAETWHDPWVYPWAAQCLPAPEGVAPPPTPPGTVACQQSLAAAESSDRSQVAQSLALVADGGVWGRGLTDSTSGRLPAGSTDFVLAVVWNKLGGLTVVLLAALLALLAASLTRTRRALRGGESTDHAGLVVAGVAGMLLGQFLFVFAATVNALPHSGITAPLLSRGGQSTVALVLGVLVAVAVSYRDAGTPAPKPETLTVKWFRRPRVPVAAVVFVLCAALAVGVTVVPYTGLSETRPYCQTTAPRVDPEVCSTDRIAYERTTVELGIGGTPQYVRNRQGQRWDPIGTPTLPLDDLSGLLQVGGQGGALDLALSDVVDGSSGTSLATRLSPPSPDGPARGRVDLTIDPAIQRAAATALRSDAGGAGPLAGGVVVLDAKNGRVLAAASAPSEAATPTVKPPAVPSDTQREFAAGHPAGVRARDGSINEATACDDESPGSPCWRWRLETEPAAESAESVAERRRYVAGDEGIEPPDTDTNRALGRRYGLGSTFKVIVAATYLRRPGTSSADLIPAPVTIPVGERAIRNAGRGPCPGSVGERITLAQALAVSCNTAFVALAGTLGWDAIRDTATALGFTAGPTGERGPAWLAGARLGVDSRVPVETDPVGLGNNVLGGGDVAGTPLQMATVMAAVANGGRVVQPTLIDAVTEPGGIRRPVAGSGEAVLTPAQAGQLEDALAGTTDPGGTAHGLAAPDGRPLWVKTGTHDLFGDEVPPTDQFTRQIAWLVGFTDTRGGRVAFAVAVETRDERAGAARARWLAQQVVGAITEVRG